ncbi:MAG: metallo-mystery pair system four-Cys motif protein [Thioploca sp.]|nr:metallo-mystery pair system four-Cys motif protein [Thioploca sp.]
MHLPKNLFLFMWISLLLAACNDNEDDSVSSTTTLTTPTESTTSELTTTVKFAAMVNDQPFQCGNTYAGIGLGKGTRDNYKINDLRFYLYDIQLIDSQGNKVPLNLTQDGKWQQANVALLDFENGCLNGTSEMNTQVIGTPSNDSTTYYTGICITLGLPFALNHLDPASAPSPLNASGMLWSWTAGRKFLRLDGIGDPDGLKQSYVVHLGSTGCVDKDNNGSEPDSPCRFPNTKAVCFDNFDVSKDTIVADVGAILQASDVSYNTSNTAVGCMSGNSDPECIEIMPRLGLDFTYADGVNQPIVYPRQAELFRVIKGDDT